MVRVHPQQVAQVRVHARVQALALGRGVLFHQEAPVVADLVEAVGHVLLQRVGTRLEHQPDLRTVEGIGIEAWCGRGDAQPQAVRGEDAIAQVQPQRARLPWRHRHRYIDHVARRPDRILDADVQRDQSIVGGRQVQRGKVDGHAVQAVVHVLPAVGPAADQRLVGRRVTHPGRNQHVHDRLRMCGQGAGIPAAGTGALRQRHHRAAFGGRETSVDVAAQCVQVGVVGQRPAVDDVGLLHRAFRLGALAHVVGPDFLDRCFLLDVAETQHAAALRGNVVDAAHHAARARDQHVGGMFGVGPVGKGAEGRTTDLHPVHRFGGRQGQVQVLAAFHIGVPVRKLEVVIAAGQARAVVHARPGGFGDAIGGLPHPRLQVAGVGEFDLADAGAGRRQRRRCRAFPAEAMAPRALVAGRRHRAGRRLAACQCLHGGGVEHAVVHPDVLEVAATQEVVAALHLVGRHHPPGQAELVQRRIVIACGLCTRHFAAIDEQAHAVVLIPGEGQVQPLVGTRQCIHAERHACACQVGIGDEGIEAVPVPVDAQPGHVPAAVVGVADAEDHERRFTHRIA
ncbi:Uncharacterised protein [Stenotrophomonas maltophilia]|nr:Uncharacterised protein [Stenotrophomonas maltophilia]